jgi:toxin FitB
MASRARAAEIPAARRTPRKPAPPRRSGAPIVLDSSCWLEYFADSERAPLFAEVIAAADALVVPLITVYEVVKKLAREAGDEVAAAALTLMQQGRLVNIDMNLALAATRNGLPMADSLIYATACAHGAELWTQDAHFDGLPGVRYFAKP